jgi:hypothetical protein
LSGASGIDPSRFFDDEGGFRWADFDWFEYQGIGD